MLHFTCQEKKKRKRHNHDHKAGAEKQLVTEAFSTANSGLVMLPQTDHAKNYSYWKHDNLASTEISVPA